MIHSLNYAGELWATLEHVFLPLQRYDALSCSSVAGRLVVEHFQEIILAQLNASGCFCSRPRLQLPVIPLGIDDEAFIPPPISRNCRPCTFLYFGRFSHASKGDLVPLLLAFAKVARLVPAARLVVAGDDGHLGLSAELRKIATDLGCGPDVDVVPAPNPDRKRQLFEDADVFVAPSENLQETFGIAVAEAMAAGLPVIASDWNGYRELVVDGVTGYLVRTFLPEYSTRFDDVRGSGAMLDDDLLAYTTAVDVGHLVQAMCRLAKDATLRSQMGGAGERLARQKFRWPAIIKMHEGLWDHLEEEQQQRGAVETDTACIDLTTWRYIDVFGHYSTGRLTPHTNVRLSSPVLPSGHYESLMSSLGRPRSFFECGALRSYTERMATGDVRTIMDIASDVTNSMMEKDTSETHMRVLATVYRFVKYGILEVCE